MNIPATHSIPCDIHLDNVHFSYAESEMVFDVAIGASSMTAIVGANGSGKSTLLNLIAGFEMPQAGRILLAGMDVRHIPPDKRPISMVFQENNLFAHLTVEQNVGLGRSLRLKLSTQDRADIVAVLARVGLDGKERRKPEALSGGERQRVALARALIRQRSVLLLDEAFAALDPDLRRQMLDLVKALQSETGMTVLMVTHTPEDALYLDASLLFIEKGRICATGSAAELFGNDGPEVLHRYIGKNIRHDRPF